MKALYERLTECLQLAQESASKEAKSQKRLYDRKVGAMELHPGDRVLVRLDAFRGQRRKLKKPMLKNLTHYMAIIDNPELMTSHIGCEVHTGIP